MDYLDLTIADLHVELVKKHVTPLELTKEALRRAKSDNNNAFELILEQEALEFARHLKEPEEDNLFWGIPYVLKDNFSTKDIATTASSNSLNGYIPVYDSTVYKILKEKKAVLIAKATLDELAMGGTGTTGHLGTTFNPYDNTHTRMIGGSSCGSAAAVASSIVPFSIGSDTGDSVRKPASFGGLVGYKPTWSLISRFGLFAFSPSLDTVGFFTRSVSDSASLFNILKGHDELDFTSSRKEINNINLNKSKSIKGMKIAVIKELLDTFHDEEVVTNFHKTLSILRAKGAEISYVSYPLDILRSFYATYFVLACSESTSNNANIDGIKFGPKKEGKTYSEIMKASRSEGFSELIKRRFIFGAYALNKDNQEDVYLKAKRNRRLIVNKFNEIFKDFDAILNPATPSVAPIFNESVDRLSDEHLIADNYLCFGNFGGYPSLTLPLGFKNDLPYGLNITCGCFNDEKAFAIAKAIEDITGYYNLSVKGDK